MFYQALSPAPKAQPFLTFEIASFDVQWDKPVFRAPDLPAIINVSATIPFTSLRKTENRKTR